MYKENQKLDSLFLKYIHWERFEITQPTLSHDEFSGNIVANSIVYALEISEKLMIVEI